MFNNAYHNASNRNARITTFLMGIIFAAWFGFGIASLFMNLKYGIADIADWGLKGGLTASLTCFFVYALLRRVYSIRRIFTQDGANAFKLLAIELGILWLINFILQLFTPYGMFALLLFILAGLSYLTYRIAFSIALKIDMTLSDNMSFMNLFRMLR